MYDLAASQVYMWFLFSLAFEMANYGQVKTKKQHQGEAVDLDKMVMSKIADVGNMLTWSKLLIAVINWWPNKKQKNLAITSNLKMEKVEIVVQNVFDAYKH